MLACVLSVAITAASCAVIINGGTGPATAAADCKDVFVLAVPGTWETTAKSDPKVVPGMLGNVVNPLKAAVERGVPIPGPTSVPAGVGSPATTDMGQGAGGELAAGLTDLLPTGPSATTASTTADSSSGGTDLWPDSSAGDTSTPATADAGGDLWPDSNPDSSPAPSATTSVTVTPTPTSTTPSESEGLGLSIGFEQIPYVAQVGGPIAQVAHGDPLTLGESRAQGTASLEKRLKQINDDCSSTLR